MKRLLQLECDTEQTGSDLPKLLCVPVGDVAEFVGDAFDPFTCGLTRTGHLPEHDRDQRRRDPGRRGDIGHRRSPEAIAAPSLACVPTTVRPS